MADTIISRLLLGLDTREFRNGIRNADRSLQDFSKNVKNIGNLIGASFAVGMIQDFAIEAVKLGDQLDAATKGFERFGDAADLDQLRKATKGMVTDVQLLQSAIQAGNFGIPIEELGNLFAFAQQRAKETGQEVDYLTQSIVTGIGRKSPLILDNLGISAVQLREKLGGISAEAASIADVTKAVSAIASEELAKMGSSADDTTTKTKQLTTAFSNYQAKAGQAISEQLSGISSFLLKIEFAKQLITTLAPAALSRFFFGSNDPEGSDFKRAMESVNQTIEVQNRLLQGSRDFYEKLNTPAVNVVTTLSSLKEKLSTLRAEFEEVDVTTGRFKQLRLEIEKLDEKIKNLTNPISAMPNTETINLVSKGMKQVGMSVEGMGIQVQKATPTVEGFGKAWEYSAESLALFNELGGTFGRVLTESFNAALTNGESFFKTFIKGLKQMMAQIIATAAAAAALALALMALGVPGVKGMNFGKVFGGLYSSMGGFGAEFIDFGSTAASGSNALGGMGGGRTILRGNDIFVSNSRTNFDISRIGG